MKRNLKTDIFRVILSLLVITVHAQSLFSADSMTGWLISNGIARIAVPIFFIISGYYIHLKLDNKAGLKQYLLHILVVYCIWSLVYLPTYCNTIEPRSLLTFAFLGYYHLWFLPALILGVLLLAVINRFTKNETIILSIGIILFLTGYMMENTGLPYRSFCNGVFFGFPFIALGHYLSKKDVVKRIRPAYLYLILPISLILLLLESYSGYKSAFYHNLFISFYVLCPALFLCILKGKEYKTKTNDLGKLSSGIYYVHILAISIIQISETNNIYKLPLIMVVSVLLAIFIVLINKRIKILL